MGTEYEFVISNGTTARMWFNKFEGKWQIDHFSGDRICRVALHKDARFAINCLRRLARMWGNYTVTMV